MPVPPHDSFHTGTVNGYWFEAPINFTITYLRIPKEAGVFGQYIHLLRNNDSTPVVHPATSTNFTTLAYLSHGFPWAAHPVALFRLTQEILLGFLGRLVQAARTLFLEM